MSPCVVSIGQQVLLVALQHAASMYGPATGAPHGRNQMSCHDRKDAEQCRCSPRRLTRWHASCLPRRSLEPALRCNLLVATGDLESRWPNSLEPWTAHVYAPLGDPDRGVKKTCLLVLTHLILNDMMKVGMHAHSVWLWL